MGESLRRGMWEVLLTRVRKNGERFLAQAALTPRYDSAGKHTGFLLISKDITNGSKVGGAVPKGSTAAPGRCRLQPGCPLYVGARGGRGPAY